MQEWPKWNIHEKPPDADLPSALINFKHISL